MQEEDSDKILGNNDHNKKTESLLCDCMRSNCDQIRIDTYAQMAKIVTVCLNYHQDKNLILSI